MSMNASLANPDPSSLLTVAPGIYKLTVPGRLTGKELCAGYRHIGQDGRGMEFWNGCQPIPIDTLSPAARSEYGLRIRNPQLDVLAVPFSALPETEGRWGNRCASPGYCDGDLSYRSMITNLGIKMVAVCMECQIMMRPQVH